MRQQPAAPFWRRVIQEELVAWLPGKAMRCSRCGSENPAGAKFCDGCAAPLPLQCPSCGASNRATAKFCVECAAAAVVRFYNKRGTAEQWIKEGKQAVKMTRLSCDRCCANEVRLWVIAYNLGNLWRRLALPTRVATGSLTSLQQRLVKTGGRLIKHARYYWLLLAESHLTRQLFAGMLRTITMLPSPAG